MEIDFRLGEICLQPNQPIRRNDARGVKVVCTEGILWLTVEGKGCDVFLKPGESYAVSRKGMVLIESLGSGKLRLHSPPEASGWAKLQDAILRLRYLGHLKTGQLS